MAVALSPDRIMDRVGRVFKRDSSVYREIARDPGATREAAIVVAVVALFSAIGSLNDSFGRVIVAILGAFLSWVVFSALTYFFGKNIFGTPTTQTSTEALLRTQGYAQSPNLIRVLAFIPLIGWVFTVISWILGIIAAVQAIRETLGIGTGRAIIVAIIAGIASGIVLGMLGVIFGIGWAI